ncbi:MAG TPA: serine/threonine-protein kinase [Thermoleophilaceae bacterium]|nr:serine/threonine-protein kinase [Thermoleophilaceae bacterium]
MERPSTTEELRTELLERTGAGRFSRDVEPDTDDRVLGRYRLERRIGAGGYGVVWKGWDERLERDVAVKVIAIEGEGRATQRAEREGRVAARLNHPGIVQLYELGTDDAAVYLVSELVRGRTFAELLSGGALSDRDVARIGIVLCDALAHAHAKGVIHRDVKPQNVMVVAEPAAGAGFAKLTDFGVAHVADNDALTRTGDVVGTLAYMAPEQAEGQRVTTAADVYALALTLYEGWTGHNPVKGRAPAATARNLGRPLPSLARQRRDLPLELCATIDEALDPRPERRPSLKVLRAALQQAAGELEEEGGLVEPATLQRFGLMERDRPRVAPALPMRVVAGAAAGVLVLLAGELLGPSLPVSSLPAAAAVGVAVALLPRLAWLAAAAALLVWLGSNDELGTAVVIGVAIAPTPLLLMWGGTLWSLPALAPALGAIGLGPAYVALAGFAPTPWRRAGLGAAGYFWLVGAEVLTGNTLLYGPAPDVHARATWHDSFSGAVEHAVAPTLTSAVLLPAVVFAAFAVLLPLVVRGRALGVELMLGGAWAAGLIVALEGMDRLMDGTTPRGVVAGPLVGLALAVLAARAAPRALTESP